MPVQNYETLNTNTDVTTTRTLLHEVIPLTGTIVSGTYGTFGSERNVKNYAHGQFQSVFDYPFLSSSANHIFDITMGYDEGSVLSGTAAANVQNAKKINMYNQMSQILLGYTGSDNAVEKFESDLSFADNDNQMKECYFVNFSRLITKDQIKKGSFSITLGSGSFGNPFNVTKVLTDVSASETAGTNNKGNAGEYGVLYDNDVKDGTGYGLVFYQAGICVITASVWNGLLGSDYYRIPGEATTQNIPTCMKSTTISGNCDALRHRIQNISYNNTTEINSSIYFCRVPHTKYNYSANPTYTSGSKVRVKTVASDTPVAYITTIGLYNASNELMATAKLSEPLRKDPSNEITLRVRLDY